MTDISLTRTSFDGDDAMRNLPGLSPTKGWAIRIFFGALLSVLFLGLQSWLAAPENTFGAFLCAIIASILIIGGYSTAARLVQKTRHFERAAQPGDRITLSQTGINVSYQEGSLHLPWIAVTQIDKTPNAVLLQTDHSTLPLPTADLPSDCTVEDLIQRINDWMAKK